MAVAQVICPVCQKSRYYDADEPIEYEQVCGERDCNRILYMAKALDRLAEAMKGLNEKL